MSRLSISLLIVVAVFSAQPEHAAFSVAYDDFSFRYPPGWSVTRAAEPGAFGSVSSVAAATPCCELRDGDVKFDFAVLGVREARALGLTYARRCAGSAVETAMQCGTRMVNGVRWGWVHTRAADGATRSLYAIRERADSVVAAIGMVAEGARAAEGIARLEQIFRTFEAR
jgi:hypothetical protein